jgi:hypothetical protein
MLARLAILAASALIALLLVACDGGGGEPTTPAGEPSPTASRAVTATAEATPTPTASVEEEATQAYLDYWDAYAEAVLNLDASLLQGVAAGEELQRIQDEIEELRSQGSAVRIRVEHNYVIVDSSPDSVALFDEITNNSFLVDAESKEPTDAPGSGEILRDTFYLDKTGDTWLVVRSTRQR